MNVGHRRTYRILLSCGWLLSTGSCTSGPITPDEDQLITRWLECVECIEGELDSVAALGQRRPALVTALKERLEAGAAPDRMAAFLTVRRAGFTHDTTVVRSEGFDPTAVGLADTSTYLARYRDRYNSLVRRRATVALACIATADALAILVDTSLFSSLPPRDTAYVFAAGRRLQDSTNRARTCGAITPVQITPVP